MPAAEPPVDFDGQPNRYLLRRGNCLWRVHRRRYSARSFRSAAGADVAHGARFDGAPDDPYPHIYTALDEVTALAEILLRNLPPNREGRRAVPRRAVAGRQLSGLTLTRDLSLISLITGQDLAAVGQDHWLVTAQGGEYACTRKWAHWLRGQASWAHGLIWPSLRNGGGMAVMLFGDRCAAEFGTGYDRLLLHEVTDLAVDLDDEAGTGWLNGVLGPFRAAVPGPRN